MLQSVLGWDVEVLARNPKSSEGQPQHLLTRRADGIGARGAPAEDDQDELRRVERRTSKPPRRSVWPATEKATVETSE